MFFIILSVVLLAISVVLGANKHLPQSRYANLLRIFAGLSLLVGIFSASVRQIEAGYVGVQSLFGKVQPGFLPPGLNIVNPLVKVTTFNTKTQNYTMSGLGDEKGLNIDDPIRVLSGDGLEISLDLTVLYRVQGSEAPVILQEIGPDYQNVIVRPVVRTKIRDFAAYYDAVSLYSLKRDEFQDRITKAIESDFTKRGLVLEQLLVRNIALPSSVKQAIENKINAEQEAQKMQFVLQKEQQEAERKRIEAQGIADYQAKINSTLTEKLLTYEQIKAQKELAGSANSKIIILPQGKGSPSLIIDGK